MCAEFVFPPPKQMAVPIKGSAELFPVRRIYCVGQNYADHAKEMGSVSSSVPFYFSKPADTLVLPHIEEVPYPPKTNELHHEVELVVAIRSACKNIAVEQVLSKIFGYAVGVDLTRRDVQQLAKQSGRPWDLAKGFDHSAPISEITPIQKSGQKQDGFIRLRVNNRMKQDSNLSQMTNKVAVIIARLSEQVELQAGDLIFTGTPAGVGPLQKGDRVDAAIEGLGDRQFKII